MIGNESSLDKILDYLLYSSSDKLTISNNLHRNIEGCLEICGGCCKKVTLDYFEGTERWERFKELFPQFVDSFKREELSGLVVFSDKQVENKGHFCKFLDFKTGLCTIHTARPLMCESTPLKFKSYKTGKVLLTSETYGRKFAFKRVDGERGAKCRLTLPTEERRLEDLKILKEILYIGQKLELDVSGLEKIIKQLELKSITNE